MLRHSWTSYIVALCPLCRILFFLGFISKLQCVGLLRGHDAYIAAAAIAIRLKPRPTDHEGTVGGGNASQ